MCLLLQGSACRAATAELAMSVSIQGLGPRFRLLLNISNEGTQLATDLQVCEHCSAGLAEHKVKQSTRTSGAGETTVMHDSSCSVVPALLNQMYWWLLLPIGDDAP